MVSQGAQTGEDVAGRDTVKGLRGRQGPIRHHHRRGSRRWRSSSTPGRSTRSSITMPATIWRWTARAPTHVYAVLREAIALTGKVALTRIVTSQRERTIALRPMDGGLVAHTLNEQRDLNPAEHLFDGAKKVHLDPEMIALATQLVERQSEAYDPADLEEHYETRLRAMLDAKIAGEGVRPETGPMLAESNVIDLMAALRKSLGQPIIPAQTAENAEAEKPTKRVRKAAAATADVRTQPALKQPLQGGRRHVNSRWKPSRNGPQFATGAGA